MNKTYTIDTQDIVYVNDVRVGRFIGGVLYEEKYGKVTVY